MWKLYGQDDEQEKRGNIMKKFTGHKIIGKITIYGENAMHWAVTIESKKYGYICFRLPFFCFGKWFPLYFYLSPNATPWASTFYLGKDKIECAKSFLRRLYLGHNFNINDNEEILFRINGV